MTTCPTPPFRIPKFERLKRLAEHYGGPEFEGDTVEPYLLLVSLAKELFEIGNVKLAKYGLGEGRCSALVQLLEAQPEPLSHSQLAERLGVTKGNITGLVDGLEREGYVKRIDRDGDRRTRLITLTPAGLEVVERALGEKIRGVTGLMAGLSPAERQALTSSLLKLQERLPLYQGD